MIGTFISIASLNTLQGIREKSFWVAVLFFIFLLLFSVFLGELAIGEEVIVLRNISLCAIELSGLLLIVFGLVYNFYREKESRLKEVYLSSFSPLTYLAGKLLGFILLCALYILLTLLLSIFILTLNSAFDWYIFLGGYGIFLKLSIFCGLALFFCSLFEYPTLTSLATLFTYIGSELSSSALKIVSVSKSIFTQFLFQLLYHILPNADKIDLKTKAIYAENPHPYFLR